MQVLLIEDNPGDINLVREALAQIEMQIDLIVSRNGTEAISFLNSAIQKPNLIILDLFLPMYNGFHILEKLKADESSRNIPVVVFSSSGELENREMAMKLGAAIYTTKPAAIREYFQKVQCFIAIFS